MPTIQIQIVTTTTETKPGKTGSYQQLEVVYKNLTFQGKVESKKLMSFGGSANAFKALSDAQQGVTYTVETNKNAQGYIDWVSVTQGTGVTSDVPAAASSAVSAAKSSATKSTYETPEERAAKQVYIVRQSSIGSAVAALSTGSKTPPKVNEVIDYAKALEAYVFGNEVVDKGASGFEDLPNFDAEVQ